MSSSHAFVAGDHEGERSEWDTVAKRFFAASPLGMALVDADTGAILDANPAYCAFLHRSREELLGLTVRDVTPPEDRAAHADDVLRLTRETAAPLRHEKRLVRGDGSLVWAAVMVTPLPAAAGDRQINVVVLENISRQRQIEAATGALPLAQQWLLEQVPAAVFIHPLAPDAPPTYISPRIEAITGYRPDELMGARHDFLAPYVHPEDRVALEPLGERSDRTFEPFVATYRLRHKNGRWIWLHNVTEVVRDGGGTPRYWQGFVQDVTDRKRAEADLAEREAQFRSSFEDAAIGMTIVAPDGRFLDANPALCRFFGRTRENLLRLTFQEITHPDDLDADLAEFGRVLAGEIDRYRLDKRFLRADGGIAWGRLSVACVRDADGTVQRFVSQIEDITAQRHAEDALREAEARYRGLVEQSPAIVYTLPLDPDAPPLFVSPKIEALTGHTPEEVARNRTFLREFVHPDDLAANLQIMQESDRTLRPCVMRYRIRHRDGRWIWLLDTSDVVRDERGDPVCWQGLLVDVTAETALQEALAASEALFRATFEDAAIGMALASPNGRLTDANPAFCRLLGYTRNELLAMDFAALTHPDDLAREMEEVGRILAGEIDSYRLEKRYVRRDGGIVWVSFNGSVVRGPDGEATLAIGQVEDISAVKAAQHALAESEELFRTTVHQSRIATGIADAGGRLIDVNDALCALTGYGRDELIGMTFADLGHREGREPEQAMFREVLAGRRDGWVLEKRLVRKDGSEPWAWVNVSAVRRPDGGVERLIGQVVDVTAIHEAQRAMAEALELQQRANADLREATRQRGEFLAMLAHDFRTPLTAIQGYADLLLLAPADPEDVRESAETISRSAGRLTRMVADMLAIESLEDRLGQLHLAPTDVPALVTDAVSALHGAWPDRDIGISAEPGLPDAALDRDQVTQAVINLVGNALKYSPDGAAVRVRVHRDGDAVEIAVTDRGIGIPTDKLEAIFDKYARIRTRETAGIEGVGLGLPIVRAVARAHGGDAWAESAPGAGSTFRLRLPLAPPGETGAAG